MKILHTRIDLPTEQPTLELRDSQINYLYNNDMAFVASGKWVTYLHIDEVNNALREM